MSSVNQDKINPMWGGHYAAGPDALMERLNASIDIDRHLYRQDIAGSLAHVEMLAACEILSGEEAAQIRDGLHQIQGEIEAGEMVWKPALEDIHMHIEARLSDLIGDVAGKLHTARSRNDQVATDFRLYVREAGEALIGHIRDCQRAMLVQAERYAETVMPGFTHLQTAQPVTFGHHLMAYVEMLTRDAGRLRDAMTRANECPLGAAALAGTSFPIDREMTAMALGFDRPCANSLDAVGSRDFALELMGAAAICQTHLSRLAEELIIWTSAPFQFVTLPESFTSGSSIMPQKRNPDAAELIRAKTGQVNGQLLQLLTVVKGTPLAYNKDLQEDKQPVFATVETLSLSLQAMTGMIRGIEANAEAMLQAACGGYATATDLADWLVRVAGIPFRRAHHITGAIVRSAQEQGIYLWEVPLAEMQRIEPAIHEGVYDVLHTAYSVASRTSYGGTAPQRVQEAIAAAKARLED